MSSVSNLKAIDKNSVVSSKDEDKELICLICGKKIYFRCDLVNHMLLHRDVLEAYEAYIIKKEEESIENEKVNVDIKTEKGSCFEDKDVEFEDYASDDNSVKIEQESDDDDTKDFDDTFINEVLENDEETGIENKEHVKKKRGRPRKERRKVKKEKKAKSKKKKTRELDTVEKSYKNEKEMKRKRGRKEKEDTRQVFTCELCSFKSEKKWFLENHMKIHRDEKAYLCDQCDYTCKQRSCLSTHKLKHGETRYECTECDYKTSVPGLLTSHQAVHKEKSIFCEFCLKTFRRVGNLKEHLRTHSDARPFVCKVCTVSYKDRKSLKRHMDTHDTQSKEENILCEECDFKTHSADKLRTHKLKHKLKKRPNDYFRCQNCPFTCKWYNTFKRHSLIHTDIPAYCCGLCDYKHASKIGFKQHMKTHDQP